MAKSIAVIRGEIVRDLFLVTLKVNGSRVKRVVVDTGATSLIFNGDVARQLKLPNLGSIGVHGVGGDVAGFRSKCDVQIGTKLYSDVPCVVIKRFFRSGLLGLGFFRDHRLGLQLDPTKKTLKIYRS
jgi:predicted aspartyl protease